MATSSAGIGTLVAAVLLPPLGIFLARGLSLEFWVGALLTLVGWVPGIVFALIVVLRPGWSIAGPRARTV